MRHDNDRDATSEQPAWRRYLRFVRPNPRADVDDEFEFHIQTRVDELVATGMRPDAARQRALADMGDIAGAKNACLEIGEVQQRKRQWRDRIELIWQDVRFASRTLARSPGFTIVALLTLALSIGATTAIFSVVNGILLKPLPVADPDRLVALFESNPANGAAQVPPSGPNFLDWREDTRSFAGMSAYRFEALTITNVASPEVLFFAGVSANLFDVLGVRPMLGRGFRPGEDKAGGARVIVLSYGAWQRLFAGRRDVIGRTVSLDRQPFEIVGVLSERFTFADRVDAWRPADFTRAAPMAGLAEGTKESRAARYLGVVARLRSGVTRDQAEQEMRVVAAALAERYPAEDAGWTVSIMPLRDSIVRNVKPVLLLVLAAVAFVLLIACANVANLTLGRALSREPEMALRAALGAGRGRLQLQVLTESVLLALVGGGLGVALAWGGVRGVVRVAPADVPGITDVVVDGRVVAFALTVSFITGLLCGLASLLRVSGTTAAAMLREAGRGGVSGRRSGVVRRVLVMGEVALAVVLLVGAGLTVRSVLRLLAVNPGYLTANIVAAHVSLDGAGYQGNAAKVRYLHELTDGIAALPGVDRVGVTTTFPLTRAGIDFELAYRADGHPVLAPQSAPRADYRMVSPGYLEAMGIALRRGRTFTSYDRMDTDAPAAGDSAATSVHGSPVMLVNETFARQNWPGEDPIGKHVQLFYVRSVPWEVVGVVSDTRHQELSVAPRPQVFVPLEQAEMVFGYLTIVARTRPDAPDVVAAMRGAALAVDSSEPLYDVHTIESLRADATARDRSTALAFGAFAILAIVLAAAGIYAVIAYQVARRTREIGVRIALGASRGRIVREVVGEATTLAVIGVALGTLGALAGARLARGMLFGIAPTDPVTFSSVATLLLAVAIAAAAVPAMRAAGISPIEALRSD